MDQEFINVRPAIILGAFIGLMAAASVITGGLP